MVKFDYNRDFSTIDFRKNPELYQIGIGEQGVLLVEPYKSEILPYWCFKTPDVARESAQTIYNLFLDYKSQADFVGMDMARKFLQMGYTRSRRYANHKTGIKWNKNKTMVLPREIDDEKAQSASIFYEYYLNAKNDPLYINLKLQHKKLYEPQE
ncbi:DUF4385 domain-containing protein [Candidatus Dependentiae bacterium]|nr:DUF4385 domain-containing protein [Candidatus Dependentiae bacterium]